MARCAGASVDVAGRRIGHVVPRRGDALLQRVDRTDRLHLETPADPVGFVGIASWTDLAVEHGVLTA